MQKKIEFDVKKIFFVFKFKDEFDYIVRNIILIVNWILY